MSIHLTLAHAAVGGNALVLQLDIEITRLVQRSKLTSPLLGAFEIARINAARNNARDARA